jgi:hypothetical protein
MSQAMNPISLHIIMSTASNVHKAYGMLVTASRTSLPRSFVQTADSYLRSILFSALL